MFQSCTAQKMKFSIKGIFTFTAGLVTFTEEIPNGKLHFCAVRLYIFNHNYILIMCGHTKPVNWFRKSNQPTRFYFSGNIGLNWQLLLPRKAMPQKLQGSSKLQESFSDLWFLLLGLFPFLQEQGPHLGIYPPTKMLHRNAPTLPSTPCSSGSGFWLYLKVLCRPFS